MPLNHLSRVLLVLLLLAGTAGCGKLSPPPVTSRQKALEKFVNICQEEYKHSVAVKTVGDTVWVYIPTEEPLMDFKANGEGMTKSKTFTEKTGFAYLEAAFEGRTLQIEYDTATAKQYDGSAGYANGYTSEFQLAQKHILTAMVRAYGDLASVPGDIRFRDARKQMTHEQLVKSHLETETAPDFFVLVFADVKRGIEYKGTTYFNDLKRSATGDPALAGEEYIKRFVEETSGRQSIIGDKAGTQQRPYAVTWPEFLAKQIKTRVGFKYQTSSFPPSEDADTELMKITAETFKSYGYEDFDGVTVRNLAKGEDYLSFRKDQLTTFLP